MDIFKSDHRLSKDDQLADGLLRFEGSAYYETRVVAAGVAFFPSRSEVLAYEERVLEEAKAIKASRRSPEEIERMRQRNIENGKRSFGRPKKDPNLSPLSVD